jgi:hypothetical protein
LRELRQGQRPVTRAFRVIAGIEEVLQGHFLLGAQGNSQLHVAVSITLSALSRPARRAPNRMGSSNLVCSSRAARLGQGTAGHAAAPIIVLFRALAWSGRPSAR